uniref:Uncharacterized protein n=1 Tax=Ciona savignyi TaxID=51511 RepID=H2ZC48_CIOSA
MHSDDDFAPVAYLKLVKLHVESKPFNQPNQLVAGIRTLKSWPQQQCEIKEDEIQLQPRIHWQDEPCHKPSISSKESGHYLAVNGIYGFCEESSRNVKQATTVAMNSLMDELHNKGHCANDVTSVHLYLSDIDDFYDINSIYKTYFHHQPPSRVCVALSMGCVGANVPILQIDCLSFHNLNESVSGNLHVQSVSHWAPANIGPYSQCFTQNKTHFMAGQIGLVPGSMELIDGCYDQACLAMQ